MSWSVSGTLPEGTLESLRVSALAQNPECGDQFDAVAAAVQSIIDSGAVGKNKRFVVNMSGHANPGHEPREGWANDCVTFSLSQVP